MEIPGEKEDVDVFVSPRRFVGRTPGAKAFRKKVFEDNQKKADEKIEKNEQNGSGFDLTEVKYDYELGGEKNPGQEKQVIDEVKTSNIVSQIVRILNCIVGVLSIAMIALSLWVAINQNNGGIRAYLSIRGLVLRTPVALGISLLICSAFTCMVSLAWGVGQVAPAIAEGLQYSERKKILVAYQVFSSFALIYFTIILLAAVNPLQRLNDSKVSPDVWESMSTARPGDVCSFEMDRNCVGFKIGCLEPSASLNPSCPGRFCSETCASNKVIHNSIKDACNACRSQSFAVSDWANCKRTETSSSSSRTCRSKLWGELRKFYIIVIVTCSIGVGSTLIMSLAGAATPLLSARL